MNSSGLSDAIYQNSVTLNNNMYQNLGQMQINPSGINTPTESRTAELGAR